MIVMPACSSGWFWHCLARETQRIGHLYSPGAQRGPWPWFSFAFDNGCFSLWTPETNEFDEEKWVGSAVHEWRRMLFWSGCQTQKPRWAIVPDRPGNWEITVEKWGIYACELVEAGIPLAVAVQDGATIESVKALYPQPEVICVGGSTDWKWETAEMWIKAFPRVHILRCNSPEKLHWLDALGCESCDGTGWNRGDRRQTKGLEDWARGLMKKHQFPLWSHACRGERKGQRQLPGQPVQEVFA